MSLVKRQITLMLLATLLALASACEAEDTNWGKVCLAVLRFHNQFNAEQFQDIYAESDPRFRASISEADFIQKLRGLRQQYGQIQKSHMNVFEGIPTWWQRHFPNTRPVRSTGFNNECEKGRFQEIFRWNVQGEEPKLLEYGNELNISPPK